MKKIFTLLCICCLGFGAMAQLPINLGVHGGISSNRIKFKDIPQAIGTQANTGYMVGAFMRVNLGKLYLEPALNYSHKKSVLETQTLAVGEDPSNLDLKLNTFDIPVMLGFQVLDLSIVKLRAFLGPVLSVGKVKNLKKLGDISTDKTNWPVNRNRGYKRSAHAAHVHRRYKKREEFEIPVSPVGDVG
jgi:hypothetical protein